MSDNTQEQSEQTASENPMEELRNEFRSQFQTMKEAFDAQLAELTKQNESLTRQNTDLQRALVRSATVTDAPVATPAPKSEEDLYAEHIRAIADKALKQVKI